MDAFTPDQWLVLLLTFVLGLILGMALLANPKWKRRARDEGRRREALETENEQLRRDAREMDSLRQASVRDETRQRDDTPARDEGRLAALEAENEQLRRDAREMDSLRQAAVRDEARHRDDARPSIASDSATPGAPDRLSESDREIPPARG